MSTSKYIHGASSEEQDRLSMLNSLLNERCLREIDIQNGEKILDVGSGLGQFTRAMARAAGSKVIGIERDGKQLESALQFAKADGESHLLELRQGEAADLPLEPEEWGTFDLAHARFVLEHVTDPQAVVNQMMRCIRPGGRVVLADDDHITFRCSPEPPGMHALWRAYIRSYDRLGNDPLVGLRLVSLLHRTEAVSIRNSVVFFGSCAGNPEFQLYLENLIGILNGARDLILGEGLLDERSFNHGINGLREWGKLPDAAMWYTICWAEGRKAIP